MTKKMVCFCQDLTETDIVRAINEGFDHIETLKRYTGAFMGPCQGKMCAANVVKLYAETTGRSVEDLRIPTMRPPVEPIPLGSLVAGSDGNDDDKNL